MDKSIAYAVNNRQVMVFSYKSKLRIVEPHAYGLNKTGDGIVRAFQTGDEPGWKLFLVSEITGYHPSGEAFNDNRPGYKVGDKAMVGGIHAQLAA